MDHICVSKWINGQELFFRKDSVEEKKPCCVSNMLIKDARRLITRMQWEKEISVGESENKTNCLNFIIIS